MDTPPIEVALTGIDFIDKQHRLLLDTLADAKYWATHGAESSALLGLLGMLNGYAVRHFQDEEQWMRTNSYPGYTDHKKTHEIFISEIDKMITTVTATGQVTKSVLNFAESWLVQHIYAEAAEFKKLLRG